MLLRYLKCLCCFPVTKEEIPKLHRYWDKKDPLSYFSCLPRIFSLTLSWIFVLWPEICDPFLLILSGTVFVQQDPPQYQGVKWEGALSVLASQTCGWNWRGGEGPFTLGTTYVERREREEEREKREWYYGGERYQESGRRERKIWKDVWDVKTCSAKKLRGGDTNCLR